MWPTIIISAILAAVFAAIVVDQVKKKKSGKAVCSCGGNCAACGVNCHSGKSK